VCVENAGWDWGSLQAQRQNNLDIGKKEGVTAGTGQVVGDGIIYAVHGDCYSVHSAEDASRRIEMAFPRYLVELGWLYLGLNCSERWARWWLISPYYLSAYRRKWILRVTEENNGTATVGVNMLRR
jgi:hypothetical protein